MTYDKKCRYGSCSTPIGLTPHKSWIAVEHYCMYCEAVLGVSYKDGQGTTDTYCTVRGSEEDSGRVCSDCE